MSLELMAANRRLIAARLCWPPGTLDTCEWLDIRHPGWSVHWQPECTVPGMEHPAGYVAARLGFGGVAVCAESVPQLETAIATAPTEAREWWQRDKCCARRWHR